VHRIYWCQNISKVSAFCIFCGVLEVQPANCSPFSFLVELRMHVNYTKRTNIWKFLTPLDSTHLEVFLRILWDFFIFWIQIQILNWDRLGTGRNQNRSGPVGPVPTVSGPVPTGSVNPDRRTVVKKYHTQITNPLAFSGVPSNVFMAPKLMR
jgi:hypothetical protein